MSSKANKQKSQPDFKNEMDKYEVIKLLGEGSFGRVYKAKVISNSSFVALKVISKGRRSNKEIVGLRRECEIQQYLHHPNIIQMLHSFETPSEIVVVTEFAHKELNTILGKEGYLSEERAQPIIWDLVSALNYLHSNRVLHRDLKPQNILLDTENRAKLCDFGFARNMSTGTHVLTSIKGTPLYMAPELIEEEPYDYKADLWSLGCIMYELVVGAPPFCTSSILHLIRLIRHEQIQWPTYVSEQCVSFLKGLLQKDPGKRINWADILEQDFVKGHILISDSSNNKPLTRVMSECTLQAKEQQRKTHLINKIKGKKDEPASKPIEQEDLTNNNTNSKKETDSSNKSRERLILIEENHPIETEEWIVFIQKTMEEAVNGELTSLSQSSLANIIVAPLRNSNTSPRVLSSVTKLLSLPFVVRGVSETLEEIRIVYKDIKLIPNLVYSSKLLLRAREDTPCSQTPSPKGGPEVYKDFDDLIEEDFEALEGTFMLVNHLVHLDQDFLSQLCDAIVVLNMYSIIRFFLNSAKKVQILLDIVAILTHILRVFPENSYLVEKILCEEKCFNLGDLLRHKDFLIKERTCFFLLFLGRTFSSQKMESLWTDSIRETLEALMYDSIQSVRTAADRTVEELKSKDFYQ